jgi:hypothetical protein
MKKTLLISGVLLALTATVASADGINLAWTDCGTPELRTFACAANTGNNVMVVSYDPPPGITKLVGINSIMDLQSQSDPLPAWWDLFNPGSCRTGPTLNAVYAGAVCTDYGTGDGAGGITAYLNTGSNRRRLGGSWAYNEGFAHNVDPGTEYFAFNIVVNNLKSAGTGACAGCQDPVCIVLNDILLGQPAGEPGGSPHIINVRDRNWVTWQGPVGGQGCPGVTPTTNKTWGQLKTMYR